MGGKDQPGNAMKQERASRTWRIVSGVLVGLVLIATLRPGSLSKEAWIHGCLICGPYGAADTLRNLLLFLPLGLALSQTLKSPRQAALAILLLTIGIEVAQLVIPGRDSNPGDVVFNTLGGLVGIGLGRSIARWLTPNRPKGRVFLGAYMTAVLLLVAGLGVGARQMLPEGGVIGQWAPSRDPFAPFTGLVHTVDVDGHPLPAWSVPKGREVFRSFMDGAPMTVRVTRGDFTEPPQLLLRVVMPSHRELLAVGIHGDGLFVRPRTRLTKFRLFEPMTVVPEVFSGLEVGESLNVSLYRTGDRYCVTSSRSATERCQPAVTAGSGWMTVVNTDGWTIAERVAMIVFVVGLVGLPLGWWGGAGAGFFGVVGIAAGAWLISSFTALAFAPWEALPLVAGALAGVAGRKGLNKALRFMEAGTDLESAIAMSPSETR